MSIHRYNLILILIRKSQPTVSFHNLTRFHICFSRVCNLFLWGVFVFEWCQAKVQQRSQKAACAASGDISITENLTSALLELFHSLHPSSSSPGSQVCLISSSTFCNYTVNKSSVEGKKTNMYLLHWGIINVRMQMWSRRVADVSILLSEDTLILFQGKKWHRVIY